jgi:acyl-homoserine-lactone acylase
VHNANDSFFYTHPSQTWPAMSPLVGDDVLRVPRTRSDILEIQELLAKGKLTPERMQSQLFENRNLLASMVLPDLLAACPQAPNAAAQEACAALEKFRAHGLRNDTSAPAAHLFREFWRGASAIPNVYREPYDKTRYLATPAGLRMSDAATAARVWEAWAQAAGKVKAAGFALDARLGDVQRAVFDPQTGVAGIALHGGDNIEGVLNFLGDRARPGISPAGIRIDYGTSYVQTVTFDERGPVAHAILTYGQSAQVGSPHQLDQLKAFAEKRWPQLPWHAADVERQRIGPVLVLDKR